MKIVITISPIPEADRDDIAEFVHDALSSWGGQRHPEDPLFTSFRGHWEDLLVGSRRYINLEGNNLQRAADAEPRKKHSAPRK